MRPSFPLVVLLFALCASLACTGRSHAQQSANSFELRGEVVNSATGEPIGGALVQVYANGRQVQFTGSDGTFVFTGLPRGQFSVMARKPGFFGPGELGSWNGNNSFTIPSQAKAIVNLAPEGVIYGQVTDAAGQPLERIMVRVDCWRVEDGLKTLRPVGVGTTDDQGNFRIAELRPGTYFLSFNSAGGWRNYGTLSTKRDDHQGYGTVFYPGVHDFSSAAPIPVEPGAQVQITQALMKQPTFEVSGVVLGAIGLPGVNLMLADSMGDPAQTAVHFDRSTGRFQISGVPQGKYVLSAMAQNPLALTRGRRGMPNQQLRADLPISVASDINGVTLALGSGISIPVRIDNESTQAPAGDVPQVWIVAVSQLSPRFTRGATAPRIDDGKALPPYIEDLVPGTYTVEAKAGPLYVASLRCGSVDLLRDDLTVGPTGSLPPIDVTLRDDAAQLSGTLTQNGQPAAGGSVVIYSNDYPKRSQLVVTGNGSFSAIGLPPGTYQVVAVRDPQNLEFRNPAVMQNYLPRATSVTLGPGGQSTIHLELPPSDEAQP